MRFKHGSVCSRSGFEAQPMRALAGCLVHWCATKLGVKLEKHLMAARNLRPIVFLFCAAFATKVTSEMKRPAWQRLKSSVLQPVKEKEVLKLREGLMTYILRLILHFIVFLFCVAENVTVRCVRQAKATNGNSFAAIRAGGCV